MDMKLKYELLKKCEFLGDIFNEYKDYLNLDIQDPLLEMNFFKFLEELLADGVIELCDYRENPKKILTGSPKTQVDELRKIWPKDVDEMRLYFPDNPWYYVEWFWWRATCPIELTQLPKIEIYEEQIKQGK